MTHRPGHSGAHGNGRRLPHLRPRQGCRARMDTASSDANVLWPNVVETDGAQSSGLNETVDVEVENRLWGVSNLIKTSAGSNISGLQL